MLGHSSTRRRRQVSSPLSHLATNQNVLLTCKLTNPVTAVLIPFLSLRHSVHDFTLKNMRVYTQMKRQSSRPNHMRTGNGEIINANYYLDCKWTLTELSLDKIGAL